MVEEFEFAIASVDPKKKIAAGSFRIGTNGETSDKVVRKMFCIIIIINKINKNNLSLSQIPQLFFRPFKKIVTLVPDSIRAVPCPLERAGGHDVQAV
jgi:hypothetical protein